MDVPQMMSAAVEGNMEAQKELFNRYYERTIRLCLNRVKDREEAIELVYVTYHVFFETLGKFRYTGKGSVFKWIAGIAYIKAKEFNRKRFRWVALEEDMLTEQVVEQQVAHKVDYPTMSEILFRMKDNVYVLVVIMSALYELDHRQIGEKLNISTGTARSYLSRGHQLLRKKLQNK